ncbi:MAG: glycosyltransferase family 4 protein [Planctomycetota bacterium]
MNAPSSSSPADRPVVLLISQTYVPDPAALGQHMHDAATELVKHGYRVRVITSARGYDDPTQKFPKTEQIDGVDIERLPLSSFGKASIPIRLLGGILFLVQAVAWGLFTKNLAGILVSTSPPMAPLGALAIRRLRRIPLAFAVMDINPDQMIAMGKVKANGPAARVFNAMIRRTIRSAEVVVTLDKFMAERLERKARVGDRMVVMPPWPHDDFLEPIGHADNPFRQQHIPGDELVVMYSGNISIAHPIDTILEAAARLKDHAAIKFVFIGGKAGRERIQAYADEHGIGNLVTLPYQPLDQIKYSLSAADVHLVAMGDDMIGIVHPCKVYGALSVGRPVLGLGPAESHVGEIVDGYDAGWNIAHGDVDECEALLRRLATAEGRAEVQEKKTNAADAGKDFTKHELCGRFCEALDRVFTRHWESKRKRKGGSVAPA